MEIYLPIAEISQNIFFLLSIGYLAGILSGMFGVGGGFLTTPILILSGVPPAVAVGSEANHIVGSSLTGFLNYFRRKNVDVVMGAVLLIGGVVGSATGVYLFSLLALKGRIEEVITFSYILFLASVGLYMLLESLKTRKKKRLPPTAQLLAVPNTAHHSSVEGKDVLGQAALKRKTKLVAKKTRMAKSP